MITLTINGKKVVVTEGATILEAALQNGIENTNLCTAPYAIRQGNASCRIWRSGTVPPRAALRERRSMSLLTQAVRSLRETPIGAYSAASALGSAENYKEKEPS